MASSKISYSIKKKYSKLRDALAHKKYGTDIEKMDNSYYLIIKTTEFTGPISKKQVKAKRIMDKEFNDKILLEQIKIMEALIKKELTV